MTALVAFERAFMSRGAEAIEPGVRFGSSSGFFIPGPFHGLPGSNSGMPNESKPLETESPPERPKKQFFYLISETKYEHVSLVLVKGTRHLNNGLF